jgi:type VI secretion system protein ImpM
MSVAFVPQSLYFGKLPSRGDFVRSSASSPFVLSLDQWLSQTLELLAQDARWKLVYDSAAAIHFAILGSQSHVGLAGHLVASHDTSGRRFPFVATSSFEIPNPAQFLPYSPQALAPLWSRLDAGVRQAVQAPDFSVELQEQLTNEAPELQVRASQLQEPYKQFAQQHTLADIDAFFFDNMPDFSIRKTMLALGLLLQPVLSQGSRGLVRALTLPLPSNPRWITPIATLWTDLAARFFKQTAVEMGIFVTMHRQQPVLVIGFHGASPTTLCSVLDPDICSRNNITVHDAEWVEDYANEEAELRKLSNLLANSALSLASAVDIFRETFLGE